jgi:hypothetical protein
LGKKKEYHHQKTEHKDDSFSWGHFFSVYLTMAFLWEPYYTCAL